MKPFLGPEGQDWTYLLKKVSLLGQLPVLKKILADSGRHWQEKFLTFELGWYFYLLQ